MGVVAYIVNFVCVVLCVGACAILASLFIFGE